ncbi:MAG TPA: S41 family peptidase [Candidatus Limnocylindrales bacterium]|nr:S41 family peptidase [Candidatus Limnocylindrales bacterium]
MLAVSIVVVAVMAGTGLFLSGYSLGSQQASTPGTGASETTLFAPFWDAYHAITERYAGGEVDRQKLVEGATKGLFDALGDPYSEYLTSEEYRDSLEGLSGKFEGIGAEIATQAPDDSATECSTLGPDCQLVVIAPLAGSPAEKAGIRPGDVVIAVDGTSVDGLTAAGARDIIRGPKGTTVRLTIARDDGAPFDLSITRDIIESREVETRRLASDTVSYIRVDGFSDPAADQVADAVKAARADGVKDFVLDLRGNPGGYVTAAQEIASEFIGSGTIFWQEDADGSQVATESTGAGSATGDDIDLVVLVDRGSASASEIVAGALQDTGRGVLIGEKTFGKGTVQQWTELSPDAGGYRLTIARWFTPKKRWIHHVGLEPDVPVETPPDAPAGSDPVLDRALKVLADEAALGLEPAA